MIGDLILESETRTTSLSASDRCSAPHLAVTTEDKVRFLSSPRSYGSSAVKIDVVETHMAWVFLTEDCAFKLKKPVARPYLDFGTIDARYRDHVNELALNRRFSPDVYLAITSINVADNGALSLAGAGQPCDWVLKMRRLPAQRALDVLLTQRAVSVADIQAIATTLAAFYRTRQPVAMNIYEYRDRFERNIIENEQALTGFCNGLLRGRIKELVTRQLAFIVRRRGLFDDCVYCRRIVEGHGDLRPEHLYLTAGGFNGKIQVIDCLEFWRDFRLLDYYDDLAFLALECERLTMPKVGSDIINGVVSVTGEKPVAALVHFYQSYRAAIRAKLAVWHLLDEYDANIEKWLRVVQDYLDLAERHMKLADFGE